MSRINKICFLHSGRYRKKSGDSPTNERIWTKIIRQIDVDLMRSTPETEVSIARGQCFNGLKQQVSTAQLPHRAGEAKTAHRGVPQSPQQGARKIG